MKKFCLLLFVCLITLYSKAQDKPEIVKKSDWLTESVKEKFTVLKSDNKTKEGQYRAIYTGYNTVIALGDYKDDKKTGVWHFFDINQRLIETYDYTHNLLIAEEPMDNISRQYILYQFDVKIQDTDRVTKPVRVGGRCFGYIPYLQVFHVPRSYYDLDERLLYARLELLISPFGRLADLKVHIILADGSDQVTSFSPDIFSEEDKQFIPATINRLPVLSRIFLQCRISNSGGLDVE